MNIFKLNNPGSLSLSNESETIQLLKKINEHDFANMSSIYMLAIIQTLTSVPNEVKKALEACARIENKAERAKSLNTLTNAIKDSTSNKELKEKVSNYIKQKEKEIEKIVKETYIETAEEFFKELYTYDENDIKMSMPDDVEFFIEDSLHKALNQQCYDINFINNFNNQKYQKDSLQYEIRKQFNNAYNEIIKINNALNFQLCNNNYKFLFGQAIQTYYVQKTIQNDRYAFFNFSGAGSGKTLATLGSIYYNSNKGKNILLVVPNGVYVKGTWQEEILNKKCNTTGDQRYFFKQSIIDNVNIIDLQKNIGNYKEGYYNYFIITYSVLSCIKANDNRLNIFNDKIFDYVIFDEYQSIKCEKSIKTKNVEAILNCIIANNSKCFRIGLSATPIVNNIDEFIVLYKVLTKVFINNDLFNLKAGNKLNAIIATHRLSIAANGIYGWRWIQKEEIIENVHDEYKIVKKHIDDDFINIRYIYKHIKLNAELFTTYMSTYDFLNVQDYYKLYNDKDIYISHKNHNEKFAIYTYRTYGDVFINEIIKFLKDEIGYVDSDICLYTGNKKDNLNDIIMGNKTVLICSQPCQEGVDGLQLSISNIHILSMPWTSSAMEQLNSRFARRGSLVQNNSNNYVNIYIPLAHIIFQNGEDKSYDTYQFSQINEKGNLSDAVLDGKLNFCIDEENEIRKLCEAKLSEISSEIDEAKYEEYKYNTTFENIEISKNKNFAESIINEMHRRANTSHSYTMHSYLIENKNAEIKYHKARRESMKNWPEDPVTHVANMINKMPLRFNKIIDLGCGENMLKTFTNRFVQGVNHTNLGDTTVIEADMAHLEKHIKSSEYNVAVFCMSLWGSNYDDYNAYFSEAYRILDDEGRLIIVEPASHFGEGSQYNTIEEFIKHIESVGFKLIGSHQENRYDKLFFMFGKF